LAFTHGGFPFAGAKRFSSYSTYQTVWSLNRLDASLIEQPIQPSRAADGARKYQALSDAVWAGAALGFSALCPERRASRMRWGILEGHQRGVRIQP
jgi:hypothetical protein